MTNLCQIAILHNSFYNLSCLSRFTNACAGLVNKMTGVAIGYFDIIYGTIHPGYRI